MVNATNLRKFDFWPTNIDKYCGIFYAYACQFVGKNKRPTVGNNEGLNMFKYLQYMIISGYFIFLTEMLFSIKTSLKAIKNS